MKISKITSAKKPTISFEFFPPKTEDGAENLFKVIRDLERHKPDFVSVTYGAGGGTRALTHGLVERITKETKIPVVPHLTCVCHKKEEIQEILEQYAHLGVDNILALRGDAPQNRPDYNREEDDFFYAADLVRFIEEFNQSNSHPSEGFDIGVAGFPEGHPETPNRLKEMDYFKQKVDEGANYICTQLFFENNDLYDFRERCELAGINIPIIAGIMPLQTKKGMKRMAELSAGSRYPGKLLRRIKDVEGDDISKLGTQYAIEQCKDLMHNGIDGIHLYTLNKSTQTTEVVEAIS